MKRELETEKDISELSRTWEAQANGKPRLIGRIEDLPRLDQVGGAGVVWVLEGIFAEGALHMVTSDSGAGKSTWVAAAAYAISKGLKFMAEPRGSVRSCCSMLKTLFRQLMSDLPGFESSCMTPFMDGDNGSARIHPRLAEWLCSSGSHAATRSP